MNQLNQNHPSPQLPEILKAIWLRYWPAISIATVALVLLFVLSSIPEHKQFGLSYQYASDVTYRIDLESPRGFTPGEINTIQTKVRSWMQNNAGPDTVDANALLRFLNAEYAGYFPSDGSRGFAVTVERK